METVLKEPTQHEADLLISRLGKHFRPKRSGTGNRLDVVGFRSHPIRSTEDPLSGRLEWDVMTQCDQHAQRVAYNTDPSRGQHLESRFVRSLVELHRGHFERRRSLCRSGYQGGPDQEDAPVSAYRVPHVPLPLL